MTFFEIKSGANVHIALICNTCHPHGGRAENPSTNQSNSTISVNTFESERVEVPRMILFPNPTQHHLVITLENENQHEHFDFYIYNFSGTLLHSGLSDERTKIELNLASEFNIAILRY